LPSLFVLSGLAVLFLFHNDRVGNNADPGRQSLFLSFLLTALDLKIHVIWVSPLVVNGASLLPETVLVETLTVAKWLDEIGVHAGPNFFDLGQRGLHQFLVNNRKLLHPAQKGDDMIEALVEQEKTFVDA